MEERNVSWYEIANGDEIKQGDIFENTEVIQLADDWVDEETHEANFDAEKRDVIVMSQSCDMDKNHPKISSVLLCPLWYTEDYVDGEYLATAKGLEDARRGNLPRYHMLAACQLPSFRRKIRIVEFSQVHTLPLLHLRKKALDVGQRLSLSSPFREHLSQAFARFFMRVGLPGSGIPSFID